MSDSRPEELDPRPSEDPRLASLFFSVFCSHFHASFANQPSHSLTTSRINLFSALNRDDLGEFFIRSVTVSTCIGFVLINNGFRFSTSQNLSESVFSKQSRFAELPVWLKVTVLPGSRSGNAFCRWVVFGFRCSTQLIIGSGSCQTRLCNWVSRVDPNPNCQP